MSRLGFEMIKYDSDTVPMIQLAVLSALVDGEASAAELDAIAAGIPEHCNIEAAQVKELATKMLASYTTKKLARDPVAIVMHGKQAMMQLSGRQRQNAIKLAARVAAASPGGEANEASFLRKLKQIAHA